MFALVRFLDDDVVMIVDEADIKNFNSESVNFSKKYKVKYTDELYYKANILYINESKDELIKLQNGKRLKFPNKNLLQSESDSDGGISKRGPQLKKDKAIKIISNKKLEKNILEEFDEAVGSTPNDKSFTELTIESLKKENLELKEKIKEVEKINKSLQLEVIASQKRLEKAFNNSNNKNLTVAAGVEKSNAKVGETVGNEVHIGNGIFVNRIQFDAAFFHSKTGSQFVKSIASALFTINELKSHSVTGKQSNRIKKDSVKPPLDPVRLNAIAEIYKYYLTQKGTPENIIPVEIQKIKTYISSKISDLLRLKKNKEDQGQEDRSEETDQIIIEEEKE